MSIKSVKTRRAIKSYASRGGFTGPATVKAVMDGVPAELKERLSGKEIGCVMLAVDGAYHRGRASHGGLDLCDDAVWLPWGGQDGKGQLIPIEALRHITTETGDGVKRYTMDFTERAVA